MALLRAVSTVLSPILCVGGKPATHPFNHASYSHWEHITSWLSPGCSHWEPSVTVLGWQDFGGGRQGMLQVLGPTLPRDDALLGLGLGSPWRKGTSRQSCTTISSQPVGIRVTEAP